MHRLISQKRNKKIAWGVALAAVPTLLLSGNDYDFEPLNEQNINITIIDDGNIVELENVLAKKVSDAVKFYDEKIDEQDRVFPNLENEVFSDDTIKITREKTVKIKIADDEQEVSTYGDSLENIIAEANIELDSDDLITPNKETVVKKDLEVEIVKVEIKEEKETKKIDFETVKKDDPETSYLKKFTKTEGEHGEKEIVYEISYHNGEEVGREKVSENIIKEPVDKVIVQGTRMKLGKANKGLASWYAWTGTLACASRDYPKGTYLKVSNPANGKSVVVVVNDYGPQEWTGRIIDLDKVAFGKLASVGAGVIDVKVQEIKE